LLASQRASAQSWSMGASWCRPETPTDKANLKWQLQSNGQAGYTNIGSGGATVHCGLAKTTSGPGLANDNLTSVSATFPAAGNGTSSCRVDVRKMSADSTWGNTPPQLVDQQVKLNIGVGTTTVYTSNGSSFTNYWGTNTTWAYAELICTLTPGAAITGFAYNEAGNYQGNQRVAPASWGGMFAGSGYSYNGSGVGVLEALESQGSSFKWTGTMYPDGNSTLRIMVGPSISELQFSDMSCTFEGTTTAVMRNSPVTNDYPARVITFTRTDTNGQDDFSCSLLQNDPNHDPTASGDSKIFSYKVSP